MGNRKSKIEGNESTRSIDVQKEPKPRRKRSPSFYQMLKQGYQDLVNAIIRPPRCDYDLISLGPSKFEFCGLNYHRKDFEVINSRGLKLVCSVWEPAPLCRPQARMPCVIYMHGNSSSRVEAISQISTVLSVGAVLVSFDFAGSGLSEGDFVSLGLYEKDDLKCVVEYLRASGEISYISLWGRSMGAATALMYANSDPSIAGMILDSAYSDLKTLAGEIVEKGRKNGLFAPHFVVNMVIRSIRSTIKKTANFDINHLAPIAHAKECFVPVLFVAGSHDEFIPSHHSQNIYDVYGGDKNIIFVNGDHNSVRPKFFLTSAAIFLMNVLQISPESVLEHSQDYLDRLPWSVRKTSPSSRPNWSSYSSNANGSPSTQNRSSPSNLHGESRVITDEEMEALINTAIQILGCELTDDNDNESSSKLRVNSSGIDDPKFRRDSGLRIGSPTKLSLSELGSSNVYSHEYHANPNNHDGHSLNSNSNNYYHDNYLPYTRSAPPSTTPEEPPVQMSIGLTTQRQGEIHNQVRGFFSLKQIFSSSSSTSPKPGSTAPLSSTTEVDQPNSDTGTPSKHVRTVSIDHSLSNNSSSTPSLLSPAKVKHSGAFLDGDVSPKTKGRKMNLVCPNNDSYTSDILDGSPSPSHLYTSVSTHELSPISSSSLSSNRVSPQSTLPKLNDKNSMNDSGISTRSSGSIVVVRGRGNSLDCSSPSNFHSSNK